VDSTPTQLTILTSDYPQCSTSELGSHLSVYIYFVYMMSILDTTGATELPVLPDCVLRCRPGGDLVEISPRAELASTQPRSPKQRPTPDSTRPAHVPKTHTPTTPNPQPVWSHTRYKTHLHARGGRAGGMLDEIVRERK
jgi:hypothetical protein